jgi:hypothetical protein
VAGDWIKLEAATVDKPEVFAIAETLSCSQGDAFLGCVNLWIWEDKQSRNGHALGVTKTTIDRVSGVTGFADALIEVGWLNDKNGTLSLPNFDRHNGKTAKERALANKRKVTERSRSERDKSVTREEKRREEKKHKRTAFALPPWIPEEPWKSWLEVRDKKKIPNTERALQLAVKDLDRLRGEGNDPVAVLEMATLKGWRGLFPVKSDAPTSDWVKEVV